MAAGEFGPTVDIGLTLNSNAYYETIEKIVMQRSQGCKHCVIPLVENKARNKMKAEFRKNMRQARFRAYRYDKDQLYRCHISALLLSQCKAEIDKMTLEDAECKIACSMAHQSKLTCLKDGKF